MESYRRNKEDTEKIDKIAKTQRNQTQRLRKQNSFFLISNTFESLKILNYFFYKFRILNIF